MFWSVGVCFNFDFGDDGVVFVSIMSVTGDSDDFFGMDFFIIVILLFIRIGMDRFGVSCFLLILLNVSSGEDQAILLAIVWSGLGDKVSSEFLVIDGGDSSFGEGIIGNWV